MFEDSNFKLKDYDLDLMKDYIRFRLNSIPSKITTSLISTHAQRKRIMPAGTPRPGPLDLSYTPYLIEPLDNLSPRSPVQRTIGLKAAQGGWTLIAECAICFYMEELPADQLFVSATDDLLKRWAARRLETAIDSYGIRDKIKVISQSKQASRKTGDLSKSKEYGGCRLDLASARSSPSLSATDKRILYRDEIDRAPRELTTGEGNWLEVSAARTNAWGDRRKIYDISTPTTYENSLIWQAYEEGDQRKFFVPCPHCGKFQELIWENSEKDFGIKAETKAGRFIKAYYICEYCKDAFFNEDKFEILKRGKWEPTAISTDQTIRSYQWSALYLPVGMNSWSYIYKKYLKALDDEEKMRAFINLYLGMPYRESGSRPKRINTYELCGSYHEGTVPQGPLFLTGAVDLQLGKKNDPDKPARLEIAICGHGSKYRTWDILYKKFLGDVNDPYSGAFEQLYQFAIDGNLKFSRNDGIEIPIVLFLVDSTEGTTQDVVFEFCRRWRNTYPSKGFKFLKDRKHEGTDELMAGNSRRYRIGKSGEEQFFEIATVFYKNIVYRNIEIPRQQTGAQRPGFCDFPIEYTKEYFHMLTQAEDRIDNGRAFVQIGNRSNEALDLRVMNLCAADIFLDGELRQLRDRMRKNGATREQTQTLSVKHVLEYLEINLQKRVEIMNDKKHNGK